MPLPEGRGWTDAIEQAKELRRQGITPEHVKEFVKERQKKKASVALKFFFQDIYPWMNERHPLPSTSKAPVPYQPAPKADALTPEQITAIKAKHLKGKA